MFGSSKDEDLLKEYFERYYEELCYIALRYVSDREEVEDIVQDFYYTLWEKKLIAKIEGPFIAYAKRAIVNRCLNQLKSQKKHSSLTGDEEIPDDRDDLELRVQRENYLDRMYERIDDLSDRQREVLYLSLHNNLTYKDISAKLNLSVNTIKTHIKLAYKNIRK